MIFEVIVHPKASKALEKLPKDIANRIKEKLDESQHDPMRYTERLVGIDGFKIRAGDYRIFVGINFNKNTLEAYSIKHRREAYKKQ